MEAMVGMSYNLPLFQNLTSLHPLGYIFSDLDIPMPIINTVHYQLINSAVLHDNWVV
jgi:hypothetical protein